MDVKVAYSKTEGAPATLDLSRIELRDVTDGTDEARHKC